MKALSFTVIGALTTLTAIAAVPYGGSLTSHRSSAAERVWQPSTMQDMYDLSPDGKLVLFIDWKTGNLMVHDLSTGTDRDLTKKGTYQQNPDEAEGGVFSNDGRLIAYEWWQQTDRRDQLRVIGADGTGAKILYDKPGISPWPYSFTRDGSVLALLSASKERTLVLIPPNGGTPKVLTKIDSNNRQLATVLSDDERFVAFTEHAPNQDRKRDIIFMSVADGKVVANLRDPADDVPLRWTKNGLLFESNRNGSPGIWLQPTKDGKPSGSPKLIRGDLWRLSDRFFTRDGRFFYGVQAGDRDVFTVPVEPTTGKPTGSPVAISGKPGEQYSSTHFSPDGKYLAFMKLESGGLGYTKLVIRSLQSDEVREFLPRVFGPSRPTWIPGEQALVLQGNDKDGQPNLYRFDLRSGEASVLVPRTSSPVALSPDGKTMYYSPYMTGDSSTRVMMARNLSTGQERVIYTAHPNEYIPAHSVSRDGRTLIAMSSPFLHGQLDGPRSIIAISVENGSAHSLTSGILYDSTKQTVRAMGFTADQSGFVVMVVGTGNDTSQSLWRVPVAGGPAVSIGRAPAGLVFPGAGSAGPWINSNATRMVYIAGSIRRELWMLDDPQIRAQFTGR